MAMSFSQISIKIQLIVNKEVILIMETDTITPFDWLKDEVDEQIDSTKMTTLNSDDDSPSTTYTSSQPNDNDD